MPTYTGISSEAFRHPLDREAELALRNIPGFDLVARKFVEFLSERPQFVYHMGNSLQVGPRQYSTLYHMFREAVRDLDVYPEPALFISQTPISNAYALGQERPSIILSSGLLDLMSETEIRSILAHELGHIKCGHTTLNAMALWAISAASFVGQLTLGLSNILITSGLLMAFYEWKRKSELSADRAALLVIDDLTPVTSAMMKLAGGSVKYNNECSLEEFRRQSERYQDLDRDGLNQVYKFLLYNNLAQGVFLSHPFLVERVSYLQEWANSAEYGQIRQGNYQQSTAAAVDVPSASTASDRELDVLRQQIEELQQEINRLRSQPPNS
jgi:Zn-dependent protease with chaperone function